jgi:hypothetical protein
MARLTIDDCWSAAEIPIHRGLVTIVYQLRERMGRVPKSQTIALTNTDFKVISSFKFLQCERWVSGILQES